MADFETGVSRYIRGVAELEIKFPVDHRGNADISCNHCKYHRGDFCALTGALVHYPKYREESCPIYFPDGIN